MRADKHFVTGEVPTVVDDTNPVAVRIAVVVADVHMHEALKAHRSASLVGRSVRVHRGNTRWAVDLLTLALGVVLATQYLQGVLT